MTTTPNYSFKIAEGTDTVNLLTQSYPNFTDLDSILKSIELTGITSSVATKTGTVFQIVRTNADLNVLKFVATANYVAGDTFTVDGVSVTATAVDGTALPGGAFVINQTVMALLNGTVLTVLVGGGSAQVDAEDVDYDNSGSGLTATDVQAAIDELAARPVVAAAEDVTYDNTVSGLTATDVQAAIDELKALIPVTPQYITTGLSVYSGRCVINDGGYYIDSNNYVQVDITVTLLTNVPNDQAVVIGFPAASGSGAGNITPVFNNGVMYRDAGGSVYFNMKSSATTGTTVHYIGSYQML